MNRILVLAVLISGVFIGCSTGTKEKPVQERDQLEAPVAKSEEEMAVMPSDSGVVKLTLIDGKGSVIVEKKKDQNIYIEFTSQGYKKLTGHLSSTDSLANIRFSQIFMPDGTMDGPFGSDIEYNLNKDGVYKVSVHENMMAGDQWSGVFKAEIELKK